MLIFRNMQSYKVIKVMEEKDWHFLLKLSAVSYVKEIKVLYSKY